MKKYVLQKSPVRIPVPGNKTIEEHFGLASSGGGKFSIAHMIAPPGWQEPHQTPEFDEITILISGRKQVEIDGEMVVLNVGESLLVQKGSRVKYANPFAEPAEYWSVCIPAFSPETVNREEQKL